MAGSAAGTALAPPAIGPLFEPGSIGSLRLKNRLVMSAMGSHYAGPDSAITDRALRYYERRARGGAAMVTVEATSVHATSRIGGLLDLSDGASLDGFARLAAAIKAGGARAAIQLYHVGRETRAVLLDGRQPVAPSAVRSPVASYDAPRALSQPEISEIVAAFGRAAGRAKAAGFEAIEIHGAHGYLIAQFLSPWTNQRTDEYGGSVGNRVRFAAEIVRACRAEVGAELPLLFRVSAVEDVDGGLTLDQTIEIAQALVAEGIDALVVSGGTNSNMLRVVPFMSSPVALNAGMAARLRRSLAVPVVVVGRIASLPLAAGIVARGEADFVALGRALLCDPDLPRKGAEGRLDEVRECIACNVCVDEVLAGRGLRCLLNPELGAEGSFVIRPAPRRRRVLVVGGGPGGLEAALVLRERGHDVRLVERATELGGQVRLARVPDWKRGYQAFTDYFARRLARLGVPVTLGTEATREWVAALGPEVVVVSAGATPRRLAIPGSDGPNVVSADDVLFGRASVGPRVAVVGGGYTACETALFLAKQGRQVTLLRRGERVGAELGRSYRWFLLPALAAHGVRLLPGVRYEGVDAAGLVVRRGDETLRVDCDHVVVAVGYEPDRRLYEELRGVVPETYLVGDAVEVRNVLAAVLEAADLATRI